MDDIPPGEYHNMFKRGLHNNEHENDSEYVPQIRHHLLVLAQVHQPHPSDENLHEATNLRSYVRAVYDVLVGHLGVGNQPFIESPMDGETRLLSAADYLKITQRATRGGSTMVLLARNMSGYLGAAVNSLSNLFQAADINFTNVNSELYPCVCINIIEELIDFDDAVRATKTYMSMPSHNASHQASPHAVVSERGFSPGPDMHRAPDATHADPEGAILPYTAVPRHPQQSYVLANQLSPSTGVWHQNSGLSRALW